MYKNETEKIAKLAINKSLLKEYKNSSNERIVYMEDGSEFQIQIFNPYTYTIGVGFEFNDEYNSTYQLLVLRPGERVWLDRYLNKESKLLFSTYEVGTSKSVQEAIKNNGKIKIKIYKEKQIQHFSSNIINAINAEPWKHVDVYYNAGNTVKELCSAQPSFDFCNSVNYYQTDLSLDSLQGVAASATTYKCNNDYVTTSATTASTSTTTTYDASNHKSRSMAKSISQPLNKKMETGRIENGSHSNQRFNTVYNEFESWPFKTEVILILPSSRKPVTSNDLEKKYCVECGRKINPKFKFCPFCGHKQ